MSAAIPSDPADFPGDTIVAVITPPGQGGVAALRITGPRSYEILSRIVRHFEQGIREYPQIDWNPRYLHFGRLVDQNGAFIDEVTAVWLPAPHTYTGLDQAEIFCHGSDLVARQILRIIISAGARIAEPGEFTRLAFENGRIDLTRAEAVAEMISAQTDRATHVAREHLTGAYREHVDSLRSEALGLLAELEAGIDFTEQESYGETRSSLSKRAESLLSRLCSLSATYNQGRRLKSGVRIVIAGRPNAGKSSLFNILCKRNRAIVSPLPGTTRDYLTEWIELGGYPIELIDTAGLRSEGDDIERVGQSHARELLDSADLILWVVDGSDEQGVSSLPNVIASWQNKIGVVVRNKEEAVSSQAPVSTGWPLASISCLTESGIDRLASTIVDQLGLQTGPAPEGVIVTSARHYEKINHSMSAIQSVVTMLAQSTPPEEIVPFVREAVNHFDEITGRVCTEEVLGAIFGKFCIGK